MLIQLHFNRSATIPENAGEIPIEDRCWAIAPHLANHDIPARFVSYNGEFDGFVEHAPSILLISGQTKPGFKMPVLPAGCKVMRWLETIDSDDSPLAYDHVFASNSETLLALEQLGCRTSSLLPTGFPEEILDLADSSAKYFDIVACGEISTKYRSRAELWNTLAKAPLGLRGDLAVTFVTQDIPELPCGISMCRQEDTSRSAKYKVLAQSKIYLLTGADRDQPFPSQEFFDAASLGCVLLAETRLLAHLPECMSGVREHIHTFSSTNELIDLAYELTADSEKLRKDGAAAQHYCLREHTTKYRARIFAEVTQTL